MSGSLDIVVLGLSITSSWGNGHATNYRALLRAMAARGHDVLFLERDVPWYAAARDLVAMPGGRCELYADLDELRDRFAARVRHADLVVLGSFVPDGAELAAWLLDNARGVTAFYDIDTPVTLARLAAGEEDYLARHQIRDFDLYLSFSGGPVLDTLRAQGARRPLAFYCCVDGDAHRPLELEPQWELGYLGTYSADRQPVLDHLLSTAARMRPAGRFVVAGPQYPPELVWPANVERIEHLAPPEHAAFYCAQRFTLNVTRRDMVAAGWSPSVRIFEAAACGTPTVSDRWPGLDRIFDVGEEILVCDGPARLLELLERLPESERLAIGRRARDKVLREHSAAARVATLERALDGVVASRAGLRRLGAGGIG